MIVRVEIPGKPVGKGRARSTRDNRHYTPATTRAWEAAARVEALVAMRRAGLFEPMAGARGARIVLGGWPRRTIRGAWQ